MEKSKLDLLDKKILYELERDSRQSINMLSKKLQRSKEVINYRLKKLFEEEIISGCSAIVDMAKLNYITFRIYIKWKNVTIKDKKEFYTFLDQFKNIWTTTVLHGKWDFAFFVGIKSNNYAKTFHSMWRKIQLEFKDKISETKIALYSPIFNYNRQFFMEEKKEPRERIIGLGEVIKTDKIDEKIIKLFSINSRQPLKIIAEKLNISIETVRQRIKKLEKNKIIVGYKININLDKLGYQGYRVDFSLKSTKRNTELFEYIKQHKYFYQINQSIGGADFECEIVVKNLSHLLELLETTISRFHDVIESYEYIGYSEFPKLSIIPS
jgi:DNA-binding Lrp family transcriptional regulator